MRSNIGLGDYSTAFKEWLSAQVQERENELTYAIQGQPNRMIHIPLDLSTASAANGFEVPIPFRSMVVARIYSTATGSSKTGTISAFLDQNNIASLANAYPLQLSDILKSEKMISKCWLYWTAQSDTSADLYFFPDVEIVLGTTKTAIVGTVTVSDTLLETAQGASSTSVVGPMVQGKATTSAPTYTNNTIDPLSLDLAGNLRVSHEGTPAPSNATSTALAASQIVKASSGRLFKVNGYSATAQFIQIHDSATLPAEGAVPAVIVAVNAGGNFEIDFGPLGRSFAAGITICNSSTAAVKTIGAVDCWIDAQYK